MMEVVGKMKTIKEKYDKQMKFKKKLEQEVTTFGRLRDIFSSNNFDYKKQELQLNGPEGILCTMKTNFDDAASSAPNAILPSRACWVVDNF